jgi:Spy/CpxP family protein refolding chaperone
MHRNLLFLSVLFATSVARAAPPQNPIEAFLIQPEALFQHRDQLQLSDQQVERIRGLLEAAQQQSQGLQTRADQATGQMAELLSADTITEEAALKQLDDIIDLEREHKRLHLQLMVRIHNALTPRQRQMVATLQAGSREAEHAQATQQRLTAKVERIQNEIRKRSEAANPPFDAVEQMQKFPELMQTGKIGEAEAVLDRVLDMLGLQKQSDAPSAPPGNDGAKRLPKARLEPSSAEQVAAEVRSLRQEQVAWRNIDWQVCLVDGLRESRRQHKPLLLWVFIDRPIDDERC